MAKMDLPPDFEYERTPSPQSSGSDRSTDEEGSNNEESSKRSIDRSSLKRKHNKSVTFANEYSVEEDDDDEEVTETDEQRYMKMRYRRAGSLPSIELNRELARKIRRMLRDEEKEEEEHLNRQLTDALKFSSELDSSTSEVRYEYQFLHGQVLQVRQGDITEECVDIIVNMATSNLAHTGGIAGAIAQKGGREIQLESDRWVRKYGPVSPGNVAVTEAGQLPGNWIIHAVGPLWRGGNHREDAELWDAIWHSLIWAHKLHATSIAIPALGAGSLGFQNERCAFLLVDCIAKFFLKHPQSKLGEVRIVNINEAVTDAVIFEMVGKFTSGCETSESERDNSEGAEGEEDDDDDYSVDAEEPEDVGSGVGDDEEQPTPISAVPAHIRASPRKIGPAYLHTWRRQSIA